MSTLAAWLHDLDPYAIRFTSDFGVMWYGLSYAAGFAIAFVALRFLSVRGATPLSRDRVFDVVIYGALGAVIGGRLGYIALYQPSLFWSFGGAPPFWGVLALNQGGMASHGGMIGVLVAAVLLARGRRGPDGERVDRVPLPHVCDLFALAAPFGLFLGRIANFINGELLGRVVARPGEPAPWWAVRFPQEIGSDHDLGLRTIEQDIALGELAEAYRLHEQSPAEGLENLIATIQRGSAKAASQLEPLLSARHPSQLYQAAAEGLVVGGIVWMIARRPHRPGLISGAFLIAYGVLRIATETLRLPDAHLAVARPLGLSRGQWLSSLMIVVGIAVLIWVARSGAQRIGGWTKSGREGV